MLFLIVVYCSCLYKLGNFSGEYRRDIIEQYEKCKKDCIVFKGTNSITDMLGFVSSFKGAVIKPKNRIVENNLHLIAHNGSGFDSYVVSSNLPQWRSFLKLIKNGAGVISLEMFNGYVDSVKKIPQNLHLRCGRVHIISSLKKIGVSFKLQLSLLKQELEHDERKRMVALC